VALPRDAFRFLPPLRPTTHTGETAVICQKYQRHGSSSTAGNFKIHVGSLSSPFLYSTVFTNMMSQFFLASIIASISGISGILLLHGLALLDYSKDCDIHSVNSATIKCTGKNVILDMYLEIICSTTMAVLHLTA
jgi:hypothetical protein